MLLGGKTSVDQLTDYLRQTPSDYSDNKILEFFKDRTELVLKRIKPAELRRLCPFLKKADLKKLTFSLECTDWNFDRPARVRKEDGVWVLKESFDEFCSKRAC